MRVQLCVSCGKIPRKIVLTASRWSGRNIACSKFASDSGRRNDGTAVSGLRCLAQAALRRRRRFGMPHVENDHIVESTTEARAGVTGHNVRYVLVISTLAVIVLFAGAYL